MAHPKLKAYIQAQEKALGRQLTGPEFDQSVADLGEYKEPAVAPHGLQTLDKLASKLGSARLYGLIKGGLDTALSKGAETFPVASSVVGTAAQMLTPLATGAKYLGEEAVNAMGGVPEDYSLSKIFPETSAVLHEDPNITDVLPSLLLARGSIGRPRKGSFVPNEPPPPLASEGMLTKGARRTFNVANDPLGSLLKFPDWQKEQDFSKAKSKQQQLREELDKKIAAEQPKELPPEDLKIAEALRAKNMYPIQAESNRRLVNTQKALREQGTSSGAIASDIVNEQKYGLNDSEILYLSQHPEFMGDTWIQERAQAIANREKPVYKPALPEGGSTAPNQKELGISEELMNPPTEQLTLPLMESDAAKVGVLPEQYKGLYSVEHPRPQQLTKTVEQPALKSAENEGGSYTGPVIIGEFGTMVHPSMKVAEGSHPVSLGESKFTKEGVAIPEYELNPQENFDLTKYPDELHVPEDIYGLRRKLDEAANWVYNKQGIKEAGKDEALGSISSRLRNKYQNSTAKLAPRFRTERLKNLVDSENALNESEIFSPPKEPVKFPETVGEATTLLNRDTTRSFEQQEKLKPSVTGERDISIVNQMGGSGDPRAFAEELRIGRQYPELEEWANKVEAAKQYNKDMDSFAAKKERLEKEISSMPFSRSNINLADPKFIDDMLNHLTFWGPENTLRVYGAKAAGRAAGSALNNLSESKIGEFIKNSKKVPGPYFNIEPKEDDL